MHTVAKCFEHAVGCVVFSAFDNVGIFVSFVMHRANVVHQMTLMHLWPLHINVKIILSQ